MNDSKKKIPIFPVFIFSLYVATFVAKLVSIICSKQVLISIFSHSLEWIALVTTILAFRLKSWIIIIIASSTTWFMFMNSLSDLTLWNVGEGRWKTLNQTTSLIFCFLLPIWIGSITYLFLDEVFLSVYEKVVSKIDGKISLHCRVSVVVGLIAWTVAFCIGVYDTKYPWPKWLPFTILVLVIWGAFWLAFIREVRHGLFFLSLYLAVSCLMVNQMIVRKLQEGFVFAMNPLCITYVTLALLLFISHFVYIVDVIIGFFVNIIEEMESAIADQV